MKATEPVSEVFRFVNIRAPKARTTTAPVAESITYLTFLESIDPGDLSDIETAGGNLLYTDLLAEVSPGTTLADLKAIVTTFQGTANYRADRKSVFGQFAASDQVLDWLERNAATAT